MPPRPDEIDAFLHDRRPDAYEKLVDRLLASPHYGERWGRMWLDAARYADSDGFEKDKPRFVWFYRDWVINAFNRDLPYDRFIIEQIAGDLLPGATQEQRVATGYLRNSMINEEGGVDPEQFRMEAMFDRMDAIGKGVLGLTIQCAQCHTHKYDPLTQAEYYRMFAFLNNAHEANVTVFTPAEQMKRQEIFLRHPRDRSRPSPPPSRLARAHGRLGEEGVREPAPLERGSHDRSQGGLQRREVFAAGRRLDPRPGIRSDQASRAFHGPHRSEGDHRLSARIARRIPTCRAVGRAGRSKGPPPCPSSR